ncbi:bifunctional nuclease family protein [Candidatus Pacearchaeota archaeon]|nr:bifunctional nuclease family protein [Candidatus Pacearchaeota archaeon]
MLNIEMSVYSVGAAMVGKQRTIILKEKDGEKFLMIMVEPAQADAIKASLQQPYPVRPLTHDFVCSVINTLGATLKRVVVDGLQEETFHAKAILERDDQVIKIDCRPSDAVAISIRADTPIFVAKDVLENAGFQSDDFSKISQPMKRAQTKILVVSNDEQYLSLVSDTLIGKGHEVDTATDGIDALVRIKRVKYDAILISLDTPYINGFELYDIIQKMGQSLAGKVIVIGGQRKNQDTKDFLAKNKIPYIAKTLKAEQLVKGIHRVIDKV